MAKAKSTNVELLEAKQAELKIVRDEVKRLMTVVAQERINAKEVREQKARDRAEAAIKRAQAKLEKLTGPAGVKAKRAYRRAGKVEVIRVS